MEKIKKTALKTYVCIELHVVICTLTHQIRGQGFGFQIKSEMMFQL